MFEDLGLKYVGPIDGHDMDAVEGALRRARRFHGPVLVHCLTEKGRGYRPALEDEADRFHTVAAMDPLTCAPLIPSGGRSWTSVFGEEMVRIGAERPDVVALTAAMLDPVGLAGFAEAYPDRVWDVGIAEQHAAVSAAGLATGGLHPVVAVYATFLGRAFDQLLMDVALHRCGVTFVLDRAGVTGTDGASHNGMWDMSVLQVVPGLRIAAPRDADQLRAQLREAIDVDDAPTVVRFPKESVGQPIPALERIGGMDVLRRGDDVLLVVAGVMAPVGLARRRAAGRARHRLHRGRPALGQARRPRTARARRPPPGGGRRRGQRAQRRGGRGDRPGPAGRRGRPPAADLRHPRGVPAARQARRSARRHRTHPRRDRGPDRCGPRPRRRAHRHRGGRRQGEGRMTAAEQRSGFDLGKLLAGRGSERYDLHTRYLNHQLPRMLHTIGFDKVYERAEGAYFWDDEGQDYLDMLAGFGVMGLGRHHPVVRKALHDVLDASLADLTRFDCQPLPGLLAEKLLGHAPHLDRVFFGNSGTEAVETALKFARYATRKPRVLYCEHAFHGLTTGSLSVNGEDGFREGFAPLLPDTASRWATWARWSGS